MAIDNSISTAATIVGPVVGDTLAPYALITAPYRMLATLIPDCVIEEQHYDGTQITDHPVEIGAAISDHAFLRPSAVELRYGWANASAKTSGYVQQIYQALLAIRATRQPFNISTGKRNYTNMMMGDLRITTDVDHEYTLMVTASCREVLIAETQGGSGVSSASAANQAAPQQTGPVVNGGTVQATPTTAINPVFIGLPATGYPSTPIGS